VCSQKTGALISIEGGGNKKNEGLNCDFGFLKKTFVKPFQLKIFLSKVFL